MQLEPVAHELLVADVARVETRCSGHALREIVRVAQADQLDSIELGTHGRAGIARALLGSVAERVAARRNAQYAHFARRISASNILDW